ncbi:MAG: SDR family NAD(P)-dependent oxidoreductase [Parachlamydiaceae bacterium]
MDLELKGKRALVTGSTEGIGFAIAKALAKEGVQVIVNGRSSEKVKKAIQALGHGDFIEAAIDLSTREGVNALIDAIKDVDILINNLGIYEAKPFEEICDEDWLHMFEVNVLSGVRLSRAFFPKMIKKDFGRILFISSESGVSIPSDMIHYGMTKSAQIAISRGLAELTKGTNVTVNTILPGPTRTKGVNDFVEAIAKSKHISIEKVEEEFFETVRPTSLIKRFSEPDEVGALAAFLSSPKAGSINGAAIRIEGGIIKSMI